MSFYGCIANLHSFRTRRDLKRMLAKTRHKELVSPEW